MPYFSFGPILRPHPLSAERASSFTCTKSCQDLLGYSTTVALAEFAQGAVWPKESVSLPLLMSKVKAPQPSDESDPLWLLTVRCWVLLASRVPPSTLPKKLLWKSVGKGIIGQGYEVEGDPMSARP